MADSDRRPTAQEIEELIDLVRRDPTSPAFIDLGEAYLSLGRPRDAIQVGNLGLEANPDSLEGRVMLARGFAALHQWKEAQGELLRVVKVDRANRQGFALLGEVLLRRSDFERAVPVLQHAQNLDPTSPQILAMLRRARAGQALDPPPPIPTPIAPRGEPDRPVEIQRSRPGPSAPPPPPTGRPRQGPPVAPAAGPAAATLMQPAAVAPTMALDMGAGMPGAMAGGMADGGFGVPNHTQRGAKQTAPPPINVEGIKPRIVAAAKVQNAAAASLRQSAAVGENYLNELLTGGLLDVAGVRVPEVEYDLRPDRRWGRSTRRAFIFLFVVLVFGIGGGGTWYWWSEKRKGEQVATLQRDSRAAIKAANYSYEGMVDGLKTLQTALTLDPSDKLSHAYYVEASGIAALLYGEALVPVASDGKDAKVMAVGLEDVDQFYPKISSGDEAIKPDEPGYREMVIGKCAAELARLPLRTAPPAEIQAAANRLNEVGKSLDALLEKNKDDRWARYLKGRVQLAVGDPQSAAATFKLAGEGEDAVVAAWIDHAHLLADSGKIEEALALYKKALDKTKDHPLAVLGDALTKAETSMSPGDVIGDLNTKFVIDKLPSRVASWRWLTLAAANIANDDYKAAGEALTKAEVGHPPSEPRFWARVAWFHYRLARPGKDKQKGDLVLAFEARNKCIGFSRNAVPEPTLQLVDAAINLAAGLPEQALEVASKVEGPRSKLLRAFALVDLGKPQEAYDLAQEVLKAGPTPTGSKCEADNKRADVEARTVCEHARLLAATTDRDRLAAANALTSLASASRNQIPRHALGSAFLAFKDAPPIDPALGSNLEFAKKQLKRADSDATEDAPNPVLYRTLTQLAHIAIAENDYEGAHKTLTRALEAHPDYFPAKALSAHILVRGGQPEEALKLADQLLKVSPLPQLLMTRAEALVAKKGSSDGDRNEAKKILASLKDKPGVTNEELGKVAAEIDPKWPDDLGLPKPSAKKPDGDKPPAPAPRPKRR